MHRVVSQITAQWPWNRLRKAVSRTQPQAADEHSPLDFHIRFSNSATTLLR